MSDSKPATGAEQIFEHIDPDAMKVVRRLLQAGHEAYLVGGCVRDLYLGLSPKDFDVATSATPETIRKLFRNSRVIGRRFKLAHVFFGPKIIETSTFRAPPKQDDDDPLITHDNEWGSVEDDARRRDFTVNGLFYDVETRSIVDFVDGMDDLDQGVVRTIGEPELRFREDPVRMIRAIKFAARLGFRIEDTTWSALLEVAPDIVRSSRARLLEEIYKLLRSGASRRCFELLLETGLLHRIMPSYTTQFGNKAEGTAALRVGLRAMQGSGEDPVEDDDPMLAATDDGGSANESPATLSEGSSESADPEPAATSEQVASADAEPVVEQTAPADAEPVVEQTAPADAAPVVEQTAPADAAPTDAEPVAEQAALADAELAAEQAAPADSEPAAEQSADADSQPAAEQAAPADSQPAAEQAASADSEPATEHAADADSQPAETPEQPAKSTPAKSSRPRPSAPAVPNDGAAPPVLLWRYLDSLDDYIRHTREDVVNGVLQAVLFAPLVQRDMLEGSRQSLDRAIDRAMTPVGTSFGVARRDRELARQILMAHRRMTDQRRGRRRRSSPSQRQYFHDVLVFLGVSVHAMGTEGSELARWKAMATAPPAPNKGDRGGGGGRKRSRRRRGGRRNKKSNGGGGREAAPPRDG